MRRQDAARRLLIIVLTVAAVVETVWVALEWSY